MLQELLFAQELPEVNPASIIALQVTLMFKMNSNDEISSSEAAKEPKVQFTF